MLIQTVVLASVASLAGVAPVAGSPMTGSPMTGNLVASLAGHIMGNAGALRAGPMWAAYLLAAQQPWRVLALTPPCGRLKGEPSPPCIDDVSGPELDEALPKTSYARVDVSLPSVSDEMGGTLGGYVNVDLMDTLHLSAGPQLSWLTPDSPREDLLRLRVVAPGWGISYTWDEPAVSVGIAACTRFVMLGEDFPVVDMLTSEARIEFLLP